MRKNKIELLKILEDGYTPRVCYAVKIIFEDYKINKKPNIVFIKDINEISEGLTIEYTHTTESTFNKINIIGR